MLQSKVKRKTLFFKWTANYIDFKDRCYNTFNMHAEHEISITNKR